MKKNLLIVFMCVLMAFLAVSCDGEKETGIIVSNAEELKNAVASDDASSKTIYLSADIELSEVLVVEKDVVIDLNGHNITGKEVRAMQFKAGKSKITGIGTISSTVAKQSSSVIRVGDNEATEDVTLDVTLTIDKNVTVSTATAYGVSVFGKAKETLNVYGKIETTVEPNSDYDGCAISTNGTDVTLSTITVYDGAKISSKSNGIYLPSGYLKVEGGTIEGATAVYVKSQKLEITGGKFIATGTKKDYSSHNNGGKSTGDALVIDNCGYPNGLDAKDINVSGGEFTSQNASAVGSYVKTGDSSLEVLKGFISGGSFSSDPTEYVASGKTAKEDSGNNMWIVEVSTK